MKFRNFRIAWSVAWGVVAVLLYVLWVRSYWQSYAITVQQSGDYYSEFRWQSGQIIFSNGYEPSSGMWRKRFSLAFRSRTNEDRIQFAFPTKFVFQVAEVFPVAVIPQWSVILLCMPASAIVWLPWRFSLRTLLIATTLIAMVLGIIVWVSRTG